MAPAPFLTQPTAHRRGWSWLAGGLIAAAALVAYHGSFHIPLLMDDERTIATNTTIHRLWPLGGVLDPPPFSGVSGRPILNLSFALNYAISGNSPGSYHAANLLIHVLAGLALFGIVRRAVSDPAGLFLGFAAALLWTAHPLQTESVTYLSERAESLMGLFYLLTLYCFVRGVEGETGGQTTRLRSPVGELRRGFVPRRTKLSIWYLGSFLACLLGMGTKEVMVTAPVIVFCYDAIFVSRGPRDAWRRRRGYYLALASCWLLLAWLMAVSAQRSIGFHQGVSPARYAWTEGGSILRYLHLAVWPHPLVFDYGPGLSPIGLKGALAGLVVLLLLAATLLALRRWPKAGFLGLWFFVILAPSSSVVPVALQPTAENRMYLPLAAILVAFVLAAHRLLGTRARWLVAAIALAAVATTAARNRNYRSALDLWSDTVARRPGNPRALDSLGDALAHAGRREEAIARFREALAIAPDMGRIQYNLAKALHDQGRTQEAVSAYEQAVRLEPSYANARINLATALAEKGQWAEAAAQLREAAGIEPGNGRVRSELGVIELELGQPDPARQEFEEALRLDPGDAEAHFQLGNLLAMAGRMPEAIAQWREAIRLRPDDPVIHNNLATALAEAGQIPEAIRQYQEALRLRPDYEQARANLAGLQARGP